MGSRPRDPAPPREPGPQETRERGHATARRRDPTAGPGRDAPRSVAPTFPPGHRHRGAEGAFSAIPAPSEGTGGAGSPAAPPDPAEAPNQMNMYILICINCTKRVWGMHVRWNYAPCIRRRNKECLPFNTMLMLRGLIPGFSVTIVSRVFSRLFEGELCTSQSRDFSYS